MIFKKCLTMGIWFWYDSSQEDKIWKCHGLRLPTFPKFPRFEQLRLEMWAIEVHLSCCYLVVLESHVDPNNFTAVHSEAPNLWGGINSI